MAYTRDLTNRTFQKWEIQRYTGVPYDDSGVVILPGNRTGQKVEDYRKKIKSGQQAGSNFSIDAFKVKYGNNNMLTNFMIGDKPYWDKFTGNLYSMQTFGHLSNVTADMEARVLSRIYDSVRQQRSHVNGMNILGEARETIHQLRHPAEALRKGVLKILTSERKRITSINRIKARLQRRDAMLKSVAGTTLEINFGLKPLISDIKGIAETAARFELREPARDRIKHLQSARAVDVVTNGKWDGGTGLYLYTSSVVRFETDCSVQYIVGIDTSIQTPQGGLAKLVELSGFTAENVIPTAYELTPWSWLIDYFSNLGDVISAGTTSTTNVKWVVKTLRQSTTKSFVPTLESPKSNCEAAGFTYLDHSGAMNPTIGTRTTLTRTVGNSIPIPPLVFTHPGDSAGKLMNMLSVMEQHRKSIRF